MPGKGGLRVENFCIADFRPDIAENSQGLFWRPALWGPARFAKNVGKAFWRSLRFYLQMLLSKPIPSF
ncbi:MAG: hypothetical protein HFE86_08150 [Clostridiales bacterium]|nr:hypothetical protein [Clostridiales bacterium]